MGRMPFDNEQQAWFSDYITQGWIDHGIPVGRWRNMVWAAENLCETPIERRMLAGLIYCSFGYYSDINEVISQEDYSKHEWNHDGAVIIPQATFQGLPYRADFLVVLHSRHVKVSPCPMFVVECDGHDFHEKTKAQAARDKKRDRDIQAIGLPVFRFTGSEIHADVGECVSQLDLYGSRILEKLWGLRG